MIGLGALWGKIQGWVALAGVILAAIAVAFVRGRSEGKAYMEAEQQRKRDALQQHYDDIDRAPADPGAAYERLRHRSDK